MKENGHFVPVKGGNLTFMRLNSTIDLSGVDADNRKDPLVVMPFHQEDLGEHNHTFFELVYILEGSAEHTLGDRENILSPGDFFIVDYGSVHSYTNSRGLSLINCLFLPELIDETLKGCCSFEELMHTCLVRYCSPSLGSSLSNRVFKDEDGRVRQLMEGMLEEYQRKETGYLEVVKNRLLEIMIVMMRRLLARQPPATKNKDVLEAIRYINLHYMDKGILSDYCGQVHFNTQYFSRKFRSETGMTLVQYLQRVRIEKSCELLAGSDLRVTEVAQAVGYENTRYFQSVFCRMTKMTPREYRRRKKS